jgi:hypothetical protein
MSHSLDNAFAALAMHINALQLSTMCTAPHDAHIWFETPFVHVRDGFASVHEDFVEWEMTAPLEQRCDVYEKANIEDDFNNICKGLAYEAASLNDTNALKIILSERRPTLLPHFRSYIERTIRTYEDASSAEEVKRLAQLSQQKSALTDDDLKIGQLVLKKSAMLMDAVIGEGTSAAFLAGQELVFSGTHYSFAVSGNADRFLERSIRVDLPSIPYGLHLRTRKGEALARGCIVFPGSPILDQVTALFLHIKSGDEHTIVQKAVWYDPSELFANYLPPEDQPKKPERQQLTNVSTHLKDFGDVAEEINRLLPTVQTKVMQAIKGLLPRAISAGILPKDFQELKISLG